jgi:aspartyl aminopeptidase
MNPFLQDRTPALALIDFIDASPSPWHAAASMEERLIAKGFNRLEEGERWQFVAGGRYFVVRGGASLIAFVLGSKPMDETGLRIIGAHTDSPGLRVKPRAAQSGDGLARLGVEVYGSPILATFADRDLSLAGRVVIRTTAGQARGADRCDPSPASVSTVDRPRREGIPHGRTS